VIFEQAEVVKDNGTGYMIYTPYSKKWRALLQKKDYQAFPSETLSACFYQQPPQAFPSLAEMGFIFNKDIPDVCAVDEAIMRHYHQTRNTPSVQGTTRLGVHLRFGTVSVRKLVTTALRLNDVFLGELIWREFFMQILWHHPRVEKEACKREYDNIRWRNNEEEFGRWCRGETGYPIVDAGMRELAETALCITGCG
jgi:deoxyribodipyrimidine photo-lyase